MNWWYGKNTHPCTRKINTFIAPNWYYKLQFFFYSNFRNRDFSPEKFQNKTEFFDMNVLMWLIIMLYLNAQFCRESVIIGSRIWTIWQIKTNCFILLGICRGTDVTGVVSSHHATRHKSYCTRNNYLIIYNTTRLSNNIMTD